ncbi:putative reverse transcriptase domain-containing protein, partial [Tanacetum coccineum]
MPPKRTARTTRTAKVATATATAVAAATPMTTAAIEQLVTDRVSAALANHETLRNSTNGHGDGSHNSGTRTSGATRTPRECTYKDFLNCHPLNFKGTEGVVVLSQWFKKKESVFHISNCALENQVKFATCIFIVNALTWGNSHKKVVTQEVAYAMEWKALTKSSSPNNNNNNRGNSEATQNVITCYECGVQGHIKRDCPKLKNGNCGNQRGNDNAPA